MKKLASHIPDILYVSALIVLALFFLSSWWLNGNSHTLGDVVTYYYPRAVALHQSIHQYGEFLPLWNPYVFSGDPFLAKPSALDPLLGILLVFMKPLVALHWNVLIALFMSAVFMYFLVHYLLSNRMAAFVSAIVYLFSGFVLTTVVFYGWVVFANAYVLMPLLLLFLFKAAAEGAYEKIIFNSVISGIVLGLFIIAGSGIEFLYASIIVGLFLLVNLVGNNLRKRLLKSIIIGVVVIMVCFGLSAFKLLPVLEYQQSSVRANLSWQEASGRGIPVSKLFSELVEPGFPRVFSNPSNKIGMVAFLLVLFGLYRRFKSRYTIFFSSVVLVSLLLATGSFLLYLFWKFYPGWSGMRYANRAVILLIPAAAVLAGIGAAALFSRVKGRFGERAVHILFFVVVSMIVLDLAVFGSGGQSNAGDTRYKYRDIDEVVASNSILQHLGRERQDSIFRIHALETRGIDWGTEFYTAPLKLENIYSYDTQWMPSYLNGYLAVAMYSPAKMWGILNVKYLTSQQPVNVSGFRFVEKFSDCSVCFPEEPAIQKAWGPYLYENEKFVPRAWLADSAVLVVGDPDPSSSIIYSIMLEESFDPSKVVLIKGRDKVDNYTLDELKRYKAVVIAGGAISSSNQELIKAYLAGGGHLLPNVAEGKTTTDADDVRKLLEAVNGTSKPVDDVNIEARSFSEKTVAVGSNAGKFLVLSERFSFFPGWKAYDSKNSYELLQADNVITAVYIDKPAGPITFEYEPKSFAIGSAISIATVIVLAAYFAFVAVAAFLSRKKHAVQADVGVQE